MTFVVRSGRAASGAELTLARRRTAILHSELGRVRQASLAWRNGVGALVAGLLGFGLLRGRDDVSALAQPYGAVAGSLLLLALIAGGASALLLLRAAHGRLRLSDVRIDSAVWEHAEAVESVRSLRSGIVLFLASTGLLTAAVGLTWYAPSSSVPLLQIHTPTGWICGRPAGAVKGHSIDLKSNGAIVAVDLDAATAISAIATCP